MLVDRYIPTDGFSPALLANQFPEHAVRPSSDWIGMRQPYLDSRGRACVQIRDLNGGFTRNDSTGGESRPLKRAYLVNDLRNMGFPVPTVTNAATLRKEQWIHVDQKLQLSARQRLQAVMDLENEVPITIGNAMGKATFEYQAMSDPGEAHVDIDALTDANVDTPQFILRSVPLAITHSDFGYSQRELEISRSGDTPLDDVAIEAAGRRVAESLEDQVIGNVTGMTYATQTAGPGTHTGTSTIYGYRNYTHRLTKTNFTAPTAGGWVPDTAHNEILAALDQLYAQFYYGPFVLYHSTDWTQYMGRVYNVAGGSPAGETLYSMLAKNPNIRAVKRLDRLTATFTLLFVQLRSDVVQIINGMPLTPIQWEEKGGLAHRFKAMCIKPPLMRADYSSRTGILHGTTA